MNESPTTDARAAAYEAWLRTAYGADERLVTAYARMASAAASASLRDLLRKQHARTKLRLERLMYLGADAGMTESPARPLPAGPDEGMGAILDAADRAVPTRTAGPASDLHLARTLHRTLGFVEADYRVLYALAAGAGRAEMAELLYETLEELEADRRGAVEEINRLALG